MSADAPSGEAAGRPPLYVNPIPPETPFGPHNAAEVVGFTCHRSDRTEQQYEEDVRVWITDGGEGGALAHVRRGEAEVWLYHNEPGELIAYTSLGEKRIILGDNGEEVWADAIPYLSLHTRARQAGVSPEQRYGPRIFGGILEEIVRRSRHEYITLEVDPANPAIKLYTDFGFQEIYRVPDGARTWIIMARRNRLPI